MSALLLLLAAAAHADPERVRVGRLEGGIDVDGALDEAAWEGCEPAPALLRYSPSAGGEAPGETRICLLQDRDTLYVGVRVRGALAPPRANLSPREQLGSDDRFVLTLDPDGLGITGYRFEVNALGVQADAMVVEGEVFSAWDIPFRSAGRPRTDGYDIELAIPFRFLSVPAGERQRWGIIVERAVADEGASYAWPQLDRTHTNPLSLAGPLHGVSPGGVGAGLVLAPSLTLQHGLARGDGGGLAWAGAERWSDLVRPGLDVRSSPSPGLELAGTLLPDFSQVAADVAVIDLNRRFVARFPERRPFFLSGLDAFIDGPGTLYTRSVVEPTYGAKASGRVGNVRLGALYANDISPQPSVHEQGTPGFSEEALEGASAHTATVRLRSEMSGGSYLGVTAAEKQVYGAASPAHSANMGVDTGLRFGRAWSASGWGGFSSAGQPGDSLIGGAGALQLERRVDSGTSFKLRSEASTPGYRREMGYLTQTGLVYLGAWLEHGVDSRSGLSQWTRGLGHLRQQEAEGDSKVELYQYNKLTLSGTHALDLRGGYVGYREEGVSVPGGYGRLSWDATGSDLVAPGLSLEVAREIDYGLLLPASSASADADLTVRAGQRVQLDMRLTGELLRPDQEAVQRAARTYTTLRWQVLPDLGLRLIQQTRISGEEAPTAVDASALLTWMPEPGREAYLGATWALEPAGEGLLEQVIFFKITRAFWL